MLLPKALRMRAIKDTMALVADSIGGTKGAPAQMSWHLRHLNPARVTPCNGLAMVDFAGDNPRQSDTKYYLQEQNARGPLA